MKKRLSCIKFVKDVIIRRIKVSRSIPLCGTLFESGCPRVYRDSGSFNFIITYDTSSLLLWTFSGIGRNFKNDKNDNARYTLGHVQRTYAMPVDWNRVTITYISNENGQENLTTFLLLGYDIKFWNNINLRSLHSARVVANVGVCFKSHPSSDKVVAYYN